MDTEKLFDSVINYYAGDPKKIQHFIKVHSFAMRIGIAEALDKQTLDTLETAAIVHDVGIKNAIEKHGSGDGPYQEKEGEILAGEILSRLSYPKEIIDRVRYLVGHHHTYDSIDGQDYQILVEADFLVNMYEGKMSKDEIISVLESIFKTKTGIHLCRVMFLAAEETYR